jgi:hypothetical protein
MSGGVNVQPEVLRAAGTALNAVGGELDEVLNKLEQELLSIGEPWGRDEIGRLIGEAYKEVVRWAFDVLRGILRELRESGADLKAMADRYERLEQDLTDGFNRFLESLGIR